MKLFLDTNNVSNTSSMKTANLNVITTQRRHSAVSAASAPDPDPALLAPNVFGRPMEPVPAPLVYINGGLGVGKEAVAESLALLLGQDKSLLVDIRVIGRDDDEDAQSGTDKTWDQDLTLSFMTPEKPGYFDYFTEEEVASAVDEEAEEPDDGGREGTRRLWPSAWSHTFAVPGSNNIPNSSIPGTSPKHPSTEPSPAPLPPCSEKKLARLLSSAGNSTRVAIIAFCAFDTPMGHTAIATFATAATLADRMFVPVALTCEPVEEMRRAKSLQRGCSFKNNNSGRPNISMTTSTTGPSFAPVASIGSTAIFPARGSGFGMDGSVGSGRPSSNSFSFGARERQSGSGRSSEAPWNRSGVDGLRQRGQAQRPRQLPLACCPIITSPSGSGNGGQTADSNNGYSLTLDISKSSSFETALQLMELVKRLVVERDAEEQRDRERLLLDGGQAGEADNACDVDGDGGGDDDRFGERDRGKHGNGEGASDSESESDGDHDPDVYADSFSTMTTPLDGPGHEWKV